MLAVHAQVHLYETLDARLLKELFMHFPANSWPSANGMLLAAVLAQKGQRAKMQHNQPVIASLNFAVCIKQNNTMGGSPGWWQIRRAGIWPLPVFSLGDSPCNQPPPALVSRGLKWRLHQQASKPQLVWRWNPGDLVSNPLLIGFPRVLKKVDFTLILFNWISTTPKTLPIDTYCESPWPSA